ncbi:MAG: hypothetical protein WC700_10210 [Gemmatimonadaceae bacterium]|jgi:hypothetical protein
MSTIAIVVVLVILLIAAYFVLKPSPRRQLPDPHPNGPPAYSIKFAGGSWNASADCLAENNLPGTPNTNLFALVPSQPLPGASLKGRRATVSIDSQSPLYRSASGFFTSTMVVVDATAAVITLRPNTPPQHATLCGLGLTGAINIW